MKLPPKHLIQAELCRRSFYYFLQHFWHTIIPDDPVYNWHIEYLCEHLEQYAFRVKDRQPKESDLIINIPPSTTKTTVCTIMFPAWGWAIDPTMRFITASYSGELAVDHAVKSRDIIKSEEYKKLFGKVTIKTDQDNKKHYENNSGGSRVATSVGGTITGKHAHIIIIDDPLNPEQAVSDTERKTANRWMNETLSTRKVDKKLTPTLMIMQRLHEDDCTGNKLKKDKDIDHICLPAEEGEGVKPTALRDKYVDGLLDPVRISQDVIIEEKKNLGSYGYSGQYDQAPSPEGGGMLKDHWWNYYSLSELNDQSVTWNFAIDPAYTSKEKNDPSALIAYCYHNNNFYVADVAEVWKEFPDLCKFIPEFCQRNRWGRNSIVRVEPKASGKSIVQTLRTATSMNITESINPTKDKVARIKDIAPVIESGRVYLLRDAHWTQSFIDQCKTFPNAKHDDMVDCLEIMVSSETDNKSAVLSWSIT